MTGRPSSFTQAKTRYVEPVDFPAEFLDLMASGRGRARRIEMSAAEVREKFICDTEEQDP